MNDTSRAAFDVWNLMENEHYVPSDDTVELRRLRRCWQASRQQALTEALTACETRTDRLEAIKEQL